MIDRYADAVHARRTELRSRRALMGGGHRSELRSCLALSRLAATADIGAAFADLAREVGPHLESPERDQLPALLDTAVADTAVALRAAWAAALLPALRRIATERELRMPPGWPVLPAPHHPAPVTTPEPASAVRLLLAGAADGAALWRLALLPLAALPLLGLPALGGAATAPLAVVVGVAVVVLAARARLRAGDRLRWRRHVDAQLASARSALETDLGRQLLQIERSAGAALDRAVVQRRAELDAELSLLAPDRAVGAPGVR